MATIIEDRVRVLRLIEYEGPRSWIEHTLSRATTGRRVVGNVQGQICTITGVTITQFPEILERARATVAEAPSSHD